MLMLVVGATSAASAATKRTLSLKATPAAVTAGDKVTLSGTLSKSPKGSKVRIERLAGRKWKLLRSVRTSSSKGRFKLVLVTSGTGRTSYRAVAPKTKKLKAVTSRSRSVSVRAAVVVPAPVPPATPVPQTPPTVPPTPTEPDPVIPDPSGAGSTRVVSRATDGQESNGYSGLSAISANGRFVAYYSDATNLVPGDTNSGSDVFVWDRETATTVKVTQGLDGSAANGGSYGFRAPPAISADGRYVAFTSDASNLVVGDANGAADVFVWDRTTATTVKVTPSGIVFDEMSAGLGEHPAISADGRYVTYEAFRSTPGDVNRQVYLWDRQTSATVRVSQTAAGVPAENGAEAPAISSDGRFVTFTSSSSNLTTAADADGQSNVLVWDRQTGATVKVSRPAGGGGSNGLSGEPTISGDGRYITYRSTASNLVANDVNGPEEDDVFVWDRLTDTTTKVTSGPGGTGTNAASYTPLISSSGRHVTYFSYASNIVPGDTNGLVVDVFVWNRETGTTVNVTQGHAGNDAGSGAGRPSISSDGRYVAFESDAASHVVGDTNNARDIFLWDRFATP